MPVLVTDWDEESEAVCDVDSEDVRLRLRVSDEVSDCEVVIEVEQVGLFETLDVGEWDRVLEEENDIVFELVVDGLQDEEIVYEVDKVFDDEGVQVVDIDRDVVDVGLLLIV